ncbi:MAG TPA: DNA polymerase Y family protein [Candidatus Methylomirabilis sp.]|nr:DNA polymerase Y family protein [Candidatus Methylomirabilis sp.]
MAYACLFIPDFSVQAVVRLEPDLRDKPIAIFEGAPPLTKVFAANAAARNLGAESGMTKLQADAFSGIVWRWRSIPQEKTAYHALLDCAWTISPRVEDGFRPNEGELPDTVLLDINGCEKLFGSPEKIANDLKRVAAEVGLDANVAVAANPQAALCAARGFPDVSILAPGGERQKIGALPLATLKAPLDFIETLHRWGIHTCAEFAALPEVAVVERFGQQGRRWHLLAQASDPVPLIAKEPPAEFEECMELEFPIELLEPLMFVLNRLLDQVCVRLRMHVLATSEVQVILTLQRNDSRNRKPLLHVRTLKLPFPTKDSRSLLKLLQLDLQAHPPTSPVTAVRIVALATHGRTRQFGLFLPLSPEPERLQVTLARLQSTLGEGRVGTPVLLDTHRPNAFQLNPFVLPEHAFVQHRSKHPTTAALRIYRPPLLAFVELEDGKPQRIVCDRVKRRVLAFAGPWRTKGDWWSETSWARDEWDVLIPSLHPKRRLDSDDFHSEETALYRIYCDLRSANWFVEGIYD